MKSFDVAVIGAGINGLTAAAYLARAGRRVVVFEQRDEPGGTATITNDTGWVPPQLVSELDLARTGYAPDNTPLTVIAPTHAGDWLVLPPEIQAASDAIRRFSAKDAEKWPAFSARIATLASFLQSLYDAGALRPIPASLPEMMSLLRHGRRLRSLGKTEMVEVLRTLPMSIAELLDDWFELDILKGLIAAGGIRGIAQGPRGGGTSYVLLHHQVGRAAGVFRTSGNAAALTAALVAAARASGAEIRTNCGVAQVRVEKGKATGVVLRDGTEIGAAYVLSSADPRSTFTKLLGPVHLEPEFVHAVASIKCRGVVAYMTADIAPDAKINGVPFDDSTVLSIAPGLDYLERAFDHVKYGAASEQPCLEVRVSGQKLVAHVQYAPYALRNGGWHSAQRATFSSSVVDVLRQYAPELAGAIANIQLNTPADFETQFGLTEGNLEHAELTLDQILFMRPVAGHANYSTPIASLHLCGAGTHPGASVAGAAGRLAARAVLKS